MKKYFIFMLMAMFGFTGYILLNRPGGSANLSFGRVMGKSLKVNKSTNTALPHLSYISGDVIIQNKGSDYTAETKVNLVNGDEVFVFPRSRAIIKLGVDQYVLVEEGTKVLLEKKLRRNKGLTQFKLKSGSVLVDFFQDEDPVGIKITTPHGYTFGQDITTRIVVKEDKTMIANDRNQLFVSHNSQGEKTIEEGTGVLLTEDEIIEDNFAWVNDYDWENKLERITQAGVGRKSKIKAPLLSSRSVGKKRRRKRAPKRAISQTTSGKSKTKSLGIKNVLNKIKDSASGLTSVSDKIKESQQAIESFKQKQKDNQKVLDGL